MIFDLGLLVLCGRPVPGVAESSLCGVRCHWFTIKGAQLPASHLESNWWGDR
jgi:hypothetical protein